MVKLSNFTIGTHVECTATGKMYGARGTIQANDEGLFKSKSGYLWVVWNNPGNKAELVPQWESHKFLKII